MFLKNRKFWLGALAIGGMTYPALVYFGMPFLPPPLFILIALTLNALRFVVFRSGYERSRWVWPLLFAGMTLIAIAVVNSTIAVKAYPVLLSLAVACVFGTSLIFPPTIVEQLARLTDPELTPRGIAYTRKVTQIWTVFLIANALTSATVAMWGSLEQWTIWNGLLSYLLMGILFICEFIVRHFHRQA